jgi:RNA polymerase sigma-70 factor, ECF subfamily
MIAGQLEFQNIYIDFQPKILRYLADLAGADEAEDLSQETFIKVERGLEGFRGESQLSTWIYRIATNTALDRMRSASFQQNSHLKRGDQQDLEDVEDIADRDPISGEPAISVEKDCVRNEMSCCLMSYIERLPESHRTVLLLSDLEELGNQEIAEILG